ncbi:hypothetical protein BH24BAC1_BH24BAC1_41090 [soil metagenome]
MFDPEFEYWTRLFFKKIVASDIKIILSEVAEDELINAPGNIRKFVYNLPSKNIERIRLTEEAILLAEQYLSEKVVGKSSRADCYHIALATILKADILVSWNFKHIVNIQRINGFNGVNLKSGYQTLEIRNPREVFDYEDNN